MTAQFAGDLRVVVLLESVDEVPTEQVRVAVLKAGASGTVSAESAARIMFAGGDALDDERYIWWNFVSSSRERIDRAKKDWREQRFATVPGEDDVIALPER